MHESYVETKLKKTRNLHFINAVFQTNKQQIVQPVSIWQP